MDEESDGESTEEDEVTGVERDEELESETTEISTRRYRRETHALRCSAPLKLRPYGAIQICFYYYYYFKVHQHKATGRKTRLDIQNYAWLQRQFTLLLWCCGKKPHFLFAEPWKGVGKGMLSPWYLL